ncbi:MAG: homoserine dehydrogenase [Caldilineaceae bacterium]
MNQTIDIALSGLGNVGRNFLRILETKSDRLAADYDLALRVVAVADSSGFAVNVDGFDPHGLRLRKEAGGRVSDLPEYKPGVSLAEFLSLPGSCDFLLEASPVNLSDGEPGLGYVRAALGAGISCVLANKGPLVLAFHELHRLAAANGAGLAFSATVCGALPVVNIGRRDLIAADISLLRGIFNSTSNFILDEMAGGRSYADALAEAQRRGIAETDPSLDVEGWDTANKLTILANSFLGVEMTLADVAVEGITAITAEQLTAERAQGNVIKLVAEAKQTGNGYQLSVAPMALPADDFLAGCDGWEMGVEIHSDLYGKMFHKIWEREPLPTAAAMLRDVVNLWSD